jgi:hypothetical protein
VEKQNHGSIFCARLTIKNVEIVAGMMDTRRLVMHDALVCGTAACHVCFLHRFVVLAYVEKMLVDVSNAYALTRSGHL